MGSWGGRSSRHGCGGGDDDDVAVPPDPYVPPAEGAPACELSADCPDGTHCDLGECVQVCNRDVACGGELGREFSFELSPTATGGLTGTFEERWVGLLPVPVTVSGEITLARLPNVVFEAGGAGGDGGNAGTDGTASQTRVVGS